MNAQTAQNALFALTLSVALAGALATAGTAAQGMLSPREHAEVITLPRVVVTGTRAAAADRLAAVTLPRVVIVGRRAT